MDTEFVISVNNIVIVLLTSIMQVPTQSPNRYNKSLVIRKIERIGRSVQPWKEVRKTDEAEIRDKYDVNVRSRSSGPVLSKIK